jgi:hypothetical protein
VGLYPDFVIAETGIRFPVTVDHIPQAGVADDKSKVKALDPVVFYGVKIAALLPTPALMKRNEFGSRAVQLRGYGAQCPLIGFEPMLCLQRCHGGRRGYSPRLGC